MKLFNKLLMLLVLSSGALLTSCSDDENKLDSEITIEGEDTDLEQGYILGYGSDTDDNGDGVSIYQMVLTSDGLAINEGVVSGNGTAVVLFLVSPLTYELKDGTYTFRFDESFLKSNVFGYINYNWDVAGETVEEQYEIKSGTLKLTKSGKTFKIKFSNLVLVKDSDGSEVEGEGSFEGPMDDQSLVEGS